MKALGYDGWLSFSVPSLCLSLVQRPALNLYYWFWSSGCDLRRCEVPLWLSVFLWMAVASQRTKNALRSVQVPAVHPAKGTFQFRRTRFSRLFLADFSHRIVHHRDHVDCLISSMRPCRMRPQIRYLCEVLERQLIQTLCDNWSICSLSNLQRLDCEPVLFGRLSSDRL